MANLRINYSEAEATGKAVVEKGERFSTLLANIKTVNDDLKTSWEGSDASKYSSAVEEQAVYMKDLANTIDEIGRFLQSVGSAYRKAMEENLSAIKK